MLKLIHISCAVLTILSFSARGILMLLDSPLLQNRAIRILPHTIDAVLFTTGVLLAAKFYEYILHHHWLLLKLTAIVVYIIIGAIALRYGKTKKIRIGALLCSWLLLALIVGWATTRSPLIFF